ncbi:DUF4097 and DUF4098 domain-containing protein YvlB [Oikeobacillus pervagus]|uniref:DUF4097 and DUF4098 domain-containing protein YvlB n=1 Tax=Oikeobacillus pervagus TaxID=1325931 RepID=A0AAJ1T090_9BACI|nr:DUF4097 domain-containing protein [Oikeobacillus pervagus]MDQ0215939.1 DUF4097 and DUF4098 domain-containing protein YvlB [Oikeobacillus pervagus]
MQDERKRILELVEKGAITANDALTLLEALDEETKTKDQKESKMMNELVEVVSEKQKEESESTSKSNFEQTKEKLLNFVQMAVTKVKEIDLQLGKAVEFSHVFQHSQPNLNEIKVDMAYGNVILSPWEQEDVRVECQVKVYHSNQLDEARDTFLRNSHFNVRNGVLSFSTPFKWMKVETTFFIPNTLLNKISVKILNGSFDGRNIHTNDFEIKTGNGKIDIRKIIAEKMEAEAANGQMYITEANCGKLEAETITGSIQMDGTLKEIEAKSFNGNISCLIRNSTAKSIEVKAVTGNIEVNIPANTPIQGEIKTNLGNLLVPEQNVRIIENKKEMIQKQMIFQSEDESLKTSIQGESKTGSVMIKEIPQ